MNCYVSRPHGRIQPTHLHFLLCLLIFTYFTFPSAVLTLMLLSINPSLSPNIKLSSLPCVCDRNCFYFLDTVEFLPWICSHMGVVAFRPWRVIQTQMSFIDPSSSCSKIINGKFVVDRCNKKELGSYLLSVSASETLESVFEFHQTIWPHTGDLELHIPQQTLQKNMEALALFSCKPECMTPLRSSSEKH